MVLSLLSLSTHLVFERGLTLEGVQRIVATHLDSQIESHTHDLSILNLQRCFSNLDFPLLSPGRRLLRSGSLRKINRGGKEQTRLFFLFNDLLLHAATIEGTSNWGLGISGAFVSVNEAMGQGQEGTSCYRLVDKFELEDVTVIGTDEGQLKYGFEILSTMKSFAVYAGQSISSRLPRMTITSLSID